MTEQRTDTTESETLARTIPSDRRAEFEALAAQARALQTAPARK